MNRRSFLRAIAALPAALTLPSFCQRGAKASEPLKSTLTKKIDSSWSQTTLFNDGDLVFDAVIKR